MVLQQMLAGGSTLRLSSITSEDRYTALAHSSFPSYQVRIKKSKFCDSTVKVYTGYLDVVSGAKHLFFYFFSKAEEILQA
ncbi:hypothetical protein AcW1_004193 [Taiwanofungus camphoratus]|nr:hypothetical protein AcV5_000574 [Antrodia cinnamomea]KAI0951972.1 hypothetical protein AcV7_007915 [Antrodia cinnamomea]KAI0959344.1 hypothetical protein AcW1_004193 [Antrodia cinnamomea]